MDRYVITASLKDALEGRSETRSQRRLMSAGVVFSPCIRGIVATITFAQYVHTCACMRAC